MSEAECCRNAIVKVVSWIRVFGKLHTWRQCPSCFLKEQRECA